MSVILTSSDQGTRKIFLSKNIMNWGPAEKGNRKHCASTFVKRVTTLKRAKVTYDFSTDVTIKRIPNESVPPQR
jgi:hypothetical protein